MSPAVVVFGAWALAALSAVLVGVFRAELGEPSLALALQLAAVLLFVPIGLAVWPGLRRSVESLDPVLLTGMQGWRVLGMMFLFLWALGGLPAVFAIPAGLGDLLVGLAAPFVAERLREGRLSTKAFGWFTFLGIADFAVAFGVGNYVNLTAAPEAGFASMTAWPLVLVPGFLVPAFAMLHLAAWCAYRRVRRSTSGGTAGEFSTTGL